LANLSRKQSRELLFKMLLPLSFKTTGDFNEILQTALENDTIQPPEQEYIEKTYNAVNTNLNEIDNELKSVCVKAPFSRLSMTNLTALRLSFGEFHFAETAPLAVSVNECVSLAKKYGEEGDGILVNGILADLIKKLGASDINGNPAQANDEASDEQQK
jgi:N utilization substance protein B